MITTNLNSLFSRAHHWTHFRFKRILIFIPYLFKSRFNITFSISLGLQSDVFRLRSQNAVLWVFIVSQTCVFDVAAIGSWLFLSSSSSSTNRFLFTVSHANFCYNLTIQGSLILDCVPHIQADMHIAAENCCTSIIEYDSWICPRLCCHGLLSVRTAGRCNLRDMRSYYYAAVFSGSFLKLLMKTMSEKRAPKRI
jgi:hypothetical protein